MDTQRRFWAKTKTKKNRRNILNTLSAPAHVYCPHAPGQIEVLELAERDEGEQEAIVHRCAVRQVQTGECRQPRDESEEVLVNLRAIPQAQVLQGLESHDVLESHPRCALKSPSRFVNFVIAIATTNASVK
jgi:hypothetical protein